MNWLKKLFAPKEQVDYKQLVKDGAKIIDVRSKAEYQSGHPKNALNIPVDQIKSQLDTIKHFNKPVVLVCRSGARAGNAKRILTSNGIEAYNAGPWQNLA